MQAWSLLDTPVYLYGCATPTRRHDPSACRGLVVLCNENAPFSALNVSKGSAESKQETSITIK